MDKTIEMNSDYKILTPLEMEIDDLKHAQPLQSIQLIDKNATVEIVDGLEIRINKVSNDIDVLDEKVEDHYAELKADNKELVTMVNDDLCKQLNNLRMALAISYLGLAILILTR